MNLIGRAPQEVAKVYCNHDELLYVTYMRVGHNGISCLPPHLAFAAKFIDLSLGHFVSKYGGLREQNAYLTARNMVVTPQSVAARPGWHTDGFGTSDINYVWADKWPTVFTDFPVCDAGDNHVESMAYMTRIAESKISRVYSGAPNTIYHIDPSVVHCTPEPTEIGRRLFLRLSISPNIYDMAGNSVNYWEDEPIEMKKSREYATRNNTN